MTEMLAPGWTTGSVDSIAALVRGVTFKKTEASSQPAAGLVPILRAGNVRDGRIQFEEDLIYVPQDRVSDEQLLREGDTLIATSSGSASVVGKSALVVKNWHGAHGAFMAVLRPYAGIEPAYLAYYLQSESVRRRWRAAAAGTNINNLKRDDLLSTEVALCPVGQQQHIVVAIEDSFARLDAVRDALEVAGRRLEALTMALLTDALQFASMSTSDWRVCPLREVLDHTIGGVWGSAPGEQEVDIDVIRVTELRPHGGLDVSTAARRSITRRQLETRRLQPGDLVLEKSGGGPTTPVGRVAHFRGHERDAICTNFMQLLRPNLEEIDSDYLHCVLHQRYVSGETAAMNKGSGNIRNIDTPAYLNQQLLIPPLAIQRQVATDLTKKLQTVVHLEQSVENAQPRLEALRRAVLAAAFSGQLVR